MDRKRCPLGIVSFAIAALSTSAAAQVTLTTNDYANSGTYSTKNVVRNSTGELFCLSLDETTSADRPLLLLRSVDNGATWQPDPTPLNDATSGLNPPYAARNCAMAIDDQDRLHLTWANYTYPLVYHQWYRQYEPGSGALSPILDVSATNAGGGYASTTAMDITVDQDNTVWLVGHGIGSWREELLRSVSPYAPGQSFVSVGAISASASAQQARICVDSAGRIHCTYYRNAAPGIYEHRYYDDVTGSWSPETTLGNNVPMNDYWGAVTSDALGNVHALVVKDCHSSSIQWDFTYRRWDAQGGWGAEVPLFSATYSQHSGIANYRIVALGCDEPTGQVTAVYRDLASGGMLRTATKTLADTAFQPGIDLTPPGSTQHEFYLPTIRGSLFPTFNRTTHGLDTTWQHRPASGTPPYSLMFQRVSTEIGTPFCTATANSTGQVAVLAATGSASVVSNSLVLHTEKVSPGKPCLFMYGWLATAGTPFGDGVLCIGGGLTYFYPAVFSDQGGSAMVTVDNTQPVHSQMFPGSTLYFQAMYRDQMAGGSGFNLTDARSITFTP